MFGAYELRKYDWIAYVGHMLFPWGQAASRRVYGNGRSLTNAGYNVIVASGSEQPKSITLLDCKEDEGSFSHVGLGVCPDQRESQLRKAQRLLLSSSLRVVRWLDSQPTKPTHVVLYGGYTPYLLRLLPWCRRNRVALVADIVEWHEPNLQLGGTFGLSNLNTNIAMRYLFPKCDGIISISSFLENYYSKRGCLVVRVPPTLDFSETVSPEFVPKYADKPLLLMYAGSPGKKDLLNNVIFGIKLADPSGELFRLMVLGPDVTELRGLLGNVPLPSFVQVLGKVEQKHVAKLYQEADFSVLLREPLRFAQAGFSTKVVESLSNGVPVIANITSDLGDYIHDGCEGLVVPGHTPQDFAQTLNRALCITKTELSHMRMAARHQAERSFDYKNYTECLSTFFETVRKKNISKNLNISSYGF